MASPKMATTVHYDSGEHHVTDGAIVVARGDAVVYASGNAVVVASGNAVVFADGNAVVIARGNARVEADGDAAVVAAGDAVVITPHAHQGTVKLLGRAVHIDRSVSPMVIRTGEGEEES